MKHFFFSLCFVLLFSFSHAQDFVPPENYTFETKKDYKKYEDKVLESIDWLQSVGVNMYINQRRQTNKFLLEWMEGTPDVSIEIRGYILPYLTENPDMLMTFMGGYVKDALTNDASTTYSANLAGVRAIVTYYKDGNGLKKDKSLEKLLKLDDKNKLESWLKKQL